jgi:hypothetical protein
MRRVQDTEDEGDCIQLPQKLRYHSPPSLPIQQQQQQQWARMTVQCYGCGCRVSLDFDQSIYWEFVQYRELQTMLRLTSMLHAQTHTDCDWQTSSMPLIGCRCMIAPVLHSSAAKLTYVTGPAKRYYTRVPSLDAGHPYNYNHKFFKRTYAATEDSDSRCTCILIYVSYC